MNNKLRQKILSELKFLLNEQEDPSEEGYFSEELDDILEDINDANVKKISGFEYIDLTTMEDSTDEGELSLFVKSFKSVNKPEQLQDPEAQKAINKVCSKNILLINSVGIKDTYFYVSCKQISGGLNVPVSAKKMGVEGQEATFPLIIDQIKKGGSPTTGGETGIFCDDPKNEGKSVPDMMNFVCKGGQAVNTAPGTTPANLPSPEQPAPAQVSTQNVSKPATTTSCARCRGVTFGCAGEAVSEVQKILLKNGFKIAKEELAAFQAGSDTLEAIKAFQEKKKINVDGIVGPETCRAMGLLRRPTKQNATNTVINDPQVARAEVLKYRPECKEQSDLDNQINDILLAKKSFDNTDINKLKCPPSTLAKESKNYYDNKKLNEAKQLFNKLLKNL